MNRTEKTLHRIKRGTMNLLEVVERSEIEKLSYSSNLLETFIQAVDELIEEEQQCNKL